MLNVPVATLKEIPYDYVARFTLAGQRANRVQDVINISTDGAFVTAAIGYSFIPARLLLETTVELSTDPPTEVTASQTHIKVNGHNVEPGNLSLDALLAVIDKIPDSKPQLVNSLTECLLVRLCGIDLSMTKICG
jgi:hypothetical protein